MKKLIRLTALCLGFSIFGVCAEAPGGREPPVYSRVSAESVSLIQLVANPDDFDGRRVVVEGFLVLRDEYESSLFIDENTFSVGMTANAIAIGFEGSSDEVVARLRQFDRRYVVVSGVFTAGATSFSGGILDEIYMVTLIE